MAFRGSRRPSKMLLSVRNVSGTAGVGVETGTGVGTGVVVGVGVGVFVCAEL